MRVLEPHHFRHAKKAKRRISLKKRLFASFGVVMLSVVLGYVLFGQTVSAPKRVSDDNSTSTPEQEVVKAGPKVLKQFTNEQFKSLYSSFNYPNTQPITVEPDITGNSVADERIRAVATRRGYKLSAIPVSSIVKTGEPGLEGDDLIQPNAQIAWQELKAAATASKVALKMTSAYRSIDYQRSLFLRRLQDAGANVNTIIEGYADDEIDNVLSRAAPPGRSRHHTGYAIDLSCNGIGLEAFVNTSCYKWLSANNFENAKKFGWVPSYPEGITNAGPEPESWEYIWVGKQVLYE